jgi:hypothetical protein
MLQTGLLQVSKVESTDLSNSFIGPSGNISSTPERPNRTLDAKKGSSVTFSHKTSETEFTKQKYYSVKIVKTEIES